MCNSSNDIKSDFISIPTLVGNMRTGQKYADVYEDNYD